MRFEFPALLLLALPVIAVAILLLRRSANQALATAADFKGQAPRSAYFTTRLVLACTFLLALAIVAAQPYVAYEKGARYLFVVDVSRSMDARFSCSEPAFLERARRVMKDTIAALPEAHFGIVAFDRFAFPISHLTTDKAYLESVVDHGLYVGLMLEATQTEIANALAVVAEKMRRLPDAFGDVTHVILVSDGHVGGAWQRRMTEPLNALRSAGVRVSAVGIGNPEATPIMSEDNSLCVSQPIEMNGERVLIPLRDDILKHIATEAGGDYYTERETDRLVAALRAELSPQLSVESAAGNPKRDISGVFIAVATLALLGFVYVPTRFPEA